MPEQITNYQCPNCTGPLQFDPELQKLKCDSCGSTFDIATITAAFAEANEEALSVDDEQAQLEASETLQWSEEEAAHLRAYNCPSCGAQLITDDTTASTSCPYCGNPTVVPQQFSGSLKPDYIIPFKHDREFAIRKLKEFYKGKTFLPNEFTDKNHIEEIKGLYVPFWLYDGTAYANLQYTATRSHTHTSGDRIITTTEHYQVGRQGSVTFAKVPADASRTMPDDLMDSIEPFDYKDLVPFEMSYLPGYLANRYDVSYEEDEDRANTRMKNTAIDDIRGSIVGYETLMPQMENITIHPDQVHYAFLPVWLLTTRYAGKQYLFALNGQTGKMVADELPTSTGKFILYFIIIALIISAVAFLFISSFIR